MATNDRKTMLLKRAAEKGSCVPLCDFMIHYTTLNPMSERLADGSMLFTGGEPDPDKPYPENPKPAAVVFEGLSAGYSRELETMIKGGKILAPLKDPLLKNLMNESGSKVLTFALDDPDANFFAQNIKMTPSGNSFELVYRPSDDIGTRMVNRFLPGYDRPLFLGVTIGSTDRNDILHSVIAFACSSIMGVEPDHARSALIRYAFPSRPKEVKQEITKEDILGMREFEED